MATAKICSVDGCGKHVKSSGLCSAHAERKRKYGDPLTTIRKPPTSGPCAVAGCGEIGTSTRSMLCVGHYKRKWRYGDPAGGPRGKSAKAGEPYQWLLDHVGYDGVDCLIWPFAGRGNGYGATSTPTRKLSGAHREMCALAHGQPSAPDMVAAHSCGNGAGGCVNPKHLRWATAQENAADRVGHGTDSRGEKNAIAKLTERDVLDIRSSWPRKSQNELAREFGVKQSTIWKILNGKAWAWL